MADTTRKVVININTQGNPKGAQDVAKAIDSVASAEQRVDAGNEAFADLDTALKRTASSARQTTTEFNKLDAAAEQAAAASTSVKGLDANTKAAAGTARNFGAGIAQAGNQIQDFVVQVGSGTSALTALAQQGSQLASAFGPKGALIGALIALGAIAVKAFTDMGESAEEAKERVAAAAEQMMDLAKSVGSEEFAAFIGTLDSIGDKQLAIYDGTVNQNQALRDQAKAQSEIEKGWRKALESANAYLAATDPTFDADKAKSDLESQDRAAGRDAAIQVENDRVAQARDVYNKIFAERQAILDREEELIRRRGELEAQQQKLNDQIQQKKEIAGDSGFGANAIKALEADVERVEAQLNGVNDEINTKVPAALEKIGAKGYDMANSLQKVINDANTNIEQINEKFNAEESAAKSKAALEQVQKGAENLQKFVTDFEALTPIQQEAEANIQSALADGKITADEMKSISNNLKILQGSLKVGQEGNSQNIQSLITMTGQLITTTQQQASEIEGLKKRIGAPIR